METLHFLVQHHREILYFLLLWHVQLLYNSFCSQNEDVLKYDFFFSFWWCSSFSNILYLYYIHVCLSKVILFRFKFFYVHFKYIFIECTISSQHWYFECSSSTCAYVKKKSYYSAISSPIDSVTTTLKWTFGRITLLFSLNWFVCRLPMNTIK